MRVAVAGEFKLSISKALTDQLHEALHTLDPAPLTDENVAQLERKRGVYQLYFAGDLVYVGSASGSLQTRLAQHYRKISGRKNIDPSDVSFSCLYVDEDLTVLAPEDRLIKLFRDEGSCAWNGKGFGPHDPGRRRDETVIDDDHFDSLYPINLDWATTIAPGRYEGPIFLKRLQRNLPYTFRRQNDKQAKADYRAVEILVPSDGMAARDLLALVAKALPEYQITALRGYVIMYRGARDYPQGTKISP